MKTKQSKKIMALLACISFFVLLYFLSILYGKDPGLTLAVSLCFVLFCTSLAILCCTHTPDTSTYADDASDYVPLKKTSVPEDPKQAVFADKLSEDISVTQIKTDTTPAVLHTLFTNRMPAVEMDIIAAAKDAINALEPFAAAQDIQLHLSTVCDELIIMADPESIRILFRNIIDNSIKYMGRAGHMLITISLLGDDIFIILKDTGKGLSEEETRHVFELNFQGSNRVSGNGLGLTQTKMIVEAFSGTIYAKSSPENGMAIYIQLPVSGKHVS